MFSYFLFLIPELGNHKAKRKTIYFLFLGDFKCFPFLSSFLLVVVGDGFCFFFLAFLRFFLPPSRSGALVKAFLIPRSMSSSFANFPPLSMISSEITIVEMLLWIIDKTITIKCTYSL